STKDYYALFGFLSSSSYRLARFDSLDHNRALAEAIARARRDRWPAIQRAASEALLSGVERTGDYLLAAREGFPAVEQGVAFTAGGPGRLTFTAAARLHLEASARKRKLDPERLGLWIAHLLRAARDASDPLHAFALLVAGDDSADPRRVVDVLRPAEQAA